MGWVAAGLSIYLLLGTVSYLSRRIHIVQCVSVSVSVFLFFFLLGPFFDLDSTARGSVGPWVVVARVRLSYFLFLFRALLNARDMASNRSLFLGPWEPIQGLGGNARCMYESILFPLSSDCFPVFFEKTTTTTTTT